MCVLSGIARAAGSPPASSPQAATLATALATAASQNIKSTANVIAEAASRKLCPKVQAPIMQAAFGHAR